MLVIVEQIGILISKQLAIKCLLASMKWRKFWLQIASIKVLMREEDTLQLLQKRGRIQNNMKTNSLLRAALAPLVMCAMCVLLAVAGRPANAANGSGKVVISGQLQQWHKVILTMDGPFAKETDDDPNPFLDYRMTVTFRHPVDGMQYVVPGYFAADGNAAQTSADSGNKWRVILSPNETGKWTYQISFVRGKNISVTASEKGTPLTPYNGKSGQIMIGESTATGRDFRAQGRLGYVGKRYSQFAGSKKYSLKVGADAPELFLAYTGFDNTIQHKPSVKLLTWAPHIKDWRPGDPTWEGGRGKGTIGAINYLANSGANAFDCLTYNAGGDGDDVWPYISRSDYHHFDVSKLAQWDIVFDHAENQGVLIHDKLQETENDHKGPTALDHGDLGLERKIYLREMIAHFGYNLGLTWNLGEENMQTTAQQIAMCSYIADNDPYHHLRVIHTHTAMQDKIYDSLIGNKSALTGASLQNSWSDVHQRALKWVTDSVAAGTPWVVANDEQNPASYGVPVDPGYEGSDGVATEHGKTYTLNDIRKYTLWGNLMAGGAGVDYYFGYKMPQSDLTCNDFRSRAQSWKYGKIALDFFHNDNIPFWDMENDDAAVGNPTNSNSIYCLAKAGQNYVVYLPTGGDGTLDLTAIPGSFSVRWFNPRQGGDMIVGDVRQVQGGKPVSLGSPPNGTSDDWVVVIRRVVD